MYVDLGEDYFDKQKQQSIVRYSVRRLENLGYNVTITEPGAMYRRTAARKGKKRAGISVAMPF
jgi:hypothetical protein